MRPNSVKTVAIGLLAILIWGVAPTFFKLETRTYPLSFLLAVRFGFSCVILVPVLKRVFKRRWGKYEFQLFLSLLVSYPFLGIALTGLPASIYSVIYSLNPLFSLILLKARIDFRLIQTVFFALLGIVLMLGGLSPQDFHASFIPVVFLFFGVLGWAYYTRLVIRSHSTYNDMETTALTHFFSGLACVIWWGTVNRFSTPAVDGQFFRVSLAFGILSPIAFFSFSNSLRHLPMLGLLGQYLEPVFGLLASRVFLNEKLSPIQFTGVGFVLLGLWISRHKFVQSH